VIQLSSPDSTTEVAAVEAAPTPTQLLIQELITDCTSVLGDDVVETFVKHDDAWIRVDTPAFARAAQWAKDAGLSYFCFLGGLDWMPNPSLSGEKSFSIEGAEPVADDDQEVVVEVPADDAGGADASGSIASGYAGGETRFQVIARFYDVDRHVGLNIKCDVPPTDTVPSLTGVFAGSDWHERETWEMFGINFDGHPGIRKLYLPGEFEGHPLRKDFPLLAREVKPWPGIIDVEPIPGAGSDEGDGE
jgi:NADH-quinone oxidoreductase subunit C